MSSTAPSSQRTSTSSTPWTSPSSHSRSQLSSPKKLSTGETRRPRKESQRDRDTLSFPSVSLLDSAANVTDSTTEKSKRSRKSPAALSGSNSSSKTESLKGMSIPTRTTSNASTRSAKTSTASPIRSDQWWEHVLPPGQLAERLRKAQATARGSSSKDASVASDEGPKASRSTILRSAPPSERKIWTSLADYGRDEGRSSLEHGGASAATSTRSSVGSIPFARSDMSSFSTASSSSTEDSPTEGRSPRLTEETIRMDRSSTSSPTSIHSISRSMSSRRSRVMGSESNDHSSSSVGLGIGSAKSPTAPSPIDFDDRFRHWSFSLSSSSSSQHPTLRPFPSSASSSSGGRQSPRHHHLAQTPEVSSEEDQGPVSRSSSTSTLRTTTTTRTTRRVTRTSSSLRNLDTLAGAESDVVLQQLHSYAPGAGAGHTLPASSARRQSWAPSHNNPRHVSFNNSVEVAADERAYSNQTIGRAAGRTHSMLNDTFVEQDASQPQRRNGPGVSDSSFFRKPAVMPTTTTEALRNRGRRMPCYSAPTSPRMAFSALHQVEESKPSRRAAEGGSSSSFPTTPFPSSPRPPSPPRASESPDLALLSALGVSHAQLSTAGNIALSLTRQLSIPLRPMLQLTMFVSISSFTCMALAVFLIAGYFITAWDDVSTRGKRIQRNVNTARKSLNAGVLWCERLITGEERCSTSEEAAKDRPQHKRVSSRIVTAPLRFAIAVPATIAYKLTPTSITESLGFQEEQPPQHGREGQTKDERTTSASSSSARRGGSPTSRNGSSKGEMPPRPPLSSLLPSIFLTILIALGAGVASMFADYRGGASAAGHPASAAAAAFSSASAARSSSALPPHASSHIPLRKANSVSGHHAPHHHHHQHHRRQSVRPYDVL